MQEFDYVVIGSGSSGAIVAARLSEDPSASVLLLEAGLANRSLILHVPAAARYAFKARKFNWNYETEPEPHLNGRRLSQPRGKVLGGSSSINGLVYLRGHGLDYDAWEEAGAAGWNYARLLPYFRKLEKRTGDGGFYQGEEGPVRVSEPDPVNPIAAAFLEAGSQAGYAQTSDVNGFRQEGFGRFPMNASNGYRWSTARAYLTEARSRNNLRIWTGSAAEGIGINGGRAETVAVRRRNGRTIVGARREIIVSAGPFNSPKLLMLSGIGPASELRAHGIKVVRDLPGVGENLQDHTLSSIQMECAEPVSLAGELGPLRKARAALRWIFFRDGLLASNHFECGAFVRSAPGVRFPDIQFYLFPVAVAEGSNEFWKSQGFQVQISPQRSPSRGRVRLRSGDPGEPPRISLNLMGHPTDWDIMRTSFRLAREVLAQPAMDRFRGRELSPGPEIVSDADLDSFVRDNVQSSYHASGTCRMGADDMSVVDPECRVHGIEGLRVADSSIMPETPSCNINAPSMMIGERAADLIRQKSLPASNSGWYVDDGWKERQRPGAPVRRMDTTGG